MKLMEHQEDDFENITTATDLMVNISMWFSMASRLSKNNWSSPPGQDRLLWITNET